MELIKRFGTNCTTFQPGRKIKYIAIHYTAGTVSAKGAAENTAAYFSSKNAQGSADFIVDDETIVQYNGDIENRCCWAVGDRNLRPGPLYKVARNSNTVSIEICSRNTTGQIRAANDLSWKLTDAAVGNALTLTAELMDRYGVPIENVVRHYDISGKLCPGVYGWNPASGSEDAWHEFEARLEELTVQRFNTLAEMPDWAKPTVQKLMDKGYLAGTGDGLNWSDDMLRLLVIEDRAGVFGE